VEVSETEVGSELSYNLAGQVLSISRGDFVITNRYDQYLRRTNLIFGTAVNRVTHDYSYEAASRLSSVSEGVNSASYSYLANSLLVGNISFKQSSTTRMTTARQFDSLNRLTSIVTTNASGPVFPSVTVSSTSSSSLLAMSSCLRPLKPFPMILMATCSAMDAGPIPGMQKIASFKWLRKPMSRPWPA
jgi:hypothetical protein